jgi:hypothetical protein
LIILARIPNTPKEIWEYIKFVSNATGKSTASLLTGLNVLPALNENKNSSVILASKTENSVLARRHSTTELLPQLASNVPEKGSNSQDLFSKDTNLFSNLSQSSPNDKETEN